MNMGRPGGALAWPKGLQVWQVGGQKGQMSYSPEGADAIEEAGYPLPLGAHILGRV